MLMMKKESHLMKEQTTVSHPHAVNGELLCDESIRLTGVTEYGISWEEFTNGRVTPPREGAFFDIAFEGTLTGEKLSGTIKGIDYLQVRADGRFMLHLHATITTDDGENIAVSEEAILMPPSDDSGIGQLRLNLSFGTASSKYGWLNRRLAWGIGPIDLAAGTAEVKVYLA
jgi:hypothetical protein